jgi:hypothetical protein
MTLAAWQMELLTVAAALSTVDRRLLLTVARLRPDLRAVLADQVTALMDVQSRAAPVAADAPPHLTLLPSRAARSVRSALPGRKPALLRSRHG